MEGRRHHRSVGAGAGATLVGARQRWVGEVGFLVGGTMVYDYPHGLSVGPKPYLVATDQYAIMDRRHIDGMALPEQQSMLLDLFDADKVIDAVRPKRK